MAGTLAACTSVERQREALRSAEYAEGVVVYALDAEATELAFSVMQQGRAVNGEFREFDARLTFSGCRFEAPTLEVSVATESVFIDNPLIEAVLRGRQWFESDRWPLARFESRAIALQGNAATVDGQFTLRGVTQPVQLDVTLARAAGDEFPATLPFTTDTGFARSAFGMTAARALVDDPVSIAVNGEFDLLVRNCP